ncbi:inositol-tetrakisphosphate 1-kinase 1-like isoform X5 [Miscanthus floridulus]|uniref:inositol-tetrakisphosphate 1-kinase 1-like isoform X5 n=1 Tax=Miscanthus floridulus TaxID=154761 RepID=UPI00345878CD
MWVHGEVSDDEAAAAAVTVVGETVVPSSPPPASAAGQQQPLVVGYALTKKKVKSFLQLKLLALARKKGIQFVSIDETCPLSEQGPFDIILHKLTSKEWQHVLEVSSEDQSGSLLLCHDYREEHPEVTVDPPNAIQHLHNRQSMLQEVADLNLSNGYVAKPLVADGTSKSHELSLAYVEASLPLLDPPLVLQEFVNHGGILFKVYIVGETIQVVRRLSLPDVNTYDLGNNDGIFGFPRVSCATNNAEDADVDPCIAELPPKPLLEKLGRELRRRLGLRLFNIDMIREQGRKDRYYVIDINYFPGYGKMPGYEHIFSDFLLSLVQSKYKRHLSGS